MWGLGVAPNGDETDEMLPMNPEGAEVDVSQSVGASRPPTLNPSSTQNFVLCGTVF